MYAINDALLRDWPFTQAIYILFQLFYRKLHRHAWVRCVRDLQRLQEEFRAARLLPNDQSKPFIPLKAQPCVFYSFLAVS